MQIIDTTTEKGVTESRVDFATDDDLIPGIVWQPESVDAPCPVVLIGHGGTQHKRVPNVLAMARRIVRRLGYVAVAVDAPAHGERITDPDAAETARRNLEERISAGGDGPPLARDAEQMAAMRRRSARAAAEWSQVLDAVSELPEVDATRVGYWGVSMGTSIGLPFVAADPRVTAAVLGLNGLHDGPGRDEMEAAARSLRMPVLFVFQWDDELMTRQSGLDLWDAIGSEDKALHIFPGGHIATPLHEREAYESFFQRHLGGV